MAKCIICIYFLCLLLEICLPSPPDYDKKANEEGNPVITEVNKAAYKQVDTESKAKELLQKLQKNLSTFHSNTASPDEVRHVKKQSANILKSDTSSSSKEKSDKLGQFRTVPPEKTVRNMKATTTEVKIGTVKPNVKATESPQKVNNTKFSGRTDFALNINDKNRDLIQMVTVQSKMTLTTQSPKGIEKTTLAAEKVADIVENVGLMPGPVIIDPYDKTAEDHLFWDENIKSSSKDTNDQLHDDYERGENDWYEDISVLDSEDKSDDDTDDWEFWNDHHEVVTDKDVNVADKFGDFWDEESYARAPYLKENTKTSRWNRNERGKIRREISMMTLYCWVLFISMTMLVLYVFYKQKNVFKPYWTYLYRRPGERRSSSEDTAEERKGMVNHAYA